MHKKSVISCALLVVAMVGASVCNALAKDNFYIKDGLYVPVNKKCYKVENKDDISSEGDVEDLYVRTRNGSIIVMYGEAERYEVLKFIKKDGNLYTVLLGLKTGGTMGNRVVEKFTTTYNIASETSFTLLKQFDEQGYQDKRFKPVTYKYCGDQHIFDEEEEYYRTHGQPK